MKQENNNKEFTALYIICYVCVLLFIVAMASFLQAIRLNDHCAQLRNENDRLKSELVLLNQAEPDEGIGNEPNLK
ncbi:hypothetical protein ACFQ1M_09825 [Sungkyunkwania multivorans]|uniref:Uncharacterized protein n=1 Tax=Sungkyunkwania multivorans TaxID=1173618 RepID=A0ABW3CXI2_9FLAO